MDRDEALRLLSGGEEGIRAWNDHREKGCEIPSLTQANLAQADLTGTVLAWTNLSWANLTGTVLTQANLTKAKFIRANLIGTKFIRADFTRADFTRADLSGANLDGANLTWAKLTETDIAGTNFTRAVFGTTAFANLDLSRSHGLDEVDHNTPSTLGIDSISRSKGKIPEAFLRGCGLTPWEVLSTSFYDNSLTPPHFVEIQYKIFDAWTKGKNMINGCFISYSWNDSNFVEKLRDRLISEGVNVWLDKHDMVAGTIQDQVWRAIQLHHVVVLVLSEHSVKSDWVENELDMARRKEKAEGHAVLCPVALDDAWRAKLDATAGPGDANRALWRTLETKVVMDFSPWKTKAFDETFGKLVRGLKVNYGPKDPPVS